MASFRHSELKVNAGKDSIGLDPFAKLALPSKAVNSSCLEEVRPDEGRFFVQHVDFSPATLSHFVQAGKNRCIDSDRSCCMLKEDRYIDSNKIGVLFDHCIELSRKKDQQYRKMAYQHRRQPQARWPCVSFGEEGEEEVGMAAATPAPRIAIESSAQSDGCCLASIRL